MPEVRRDEPIRLGVLTNPIALHNNRFPFTHRNLVKHLAHASDAVVTATLAEIGPAVRHLIAERRINVLAINGGDGTIHGALNTMIEGFETGWLSAEPPVLLFLNGGTYNMASRALGTKGDPVETISRFRAKYRGSAFGQVATRELALLEVIPEGKPKIHAMVFGSEVVANALDLCARMGSGYLGLAKLLGKGVLGYLFQTRFYRENAALLNPSNPVIVVDGEALSGVAGAVASTIDLKLARGLIWSLTMPPEAKGFHAKVVRARAPGDLVRLLPYLLWEIPHPFIATFPQAQTLMTSGRFTVDGEIVEHEGTILVRTSPYRFRVVWGEVL